MIHTLALLALACMLPSLSQTPDSQPTKPHKSIEQVQPKETVSGKAEELPVKAELTLHDGSTLICSIPAQHAPFFTVHGQKIKIELTTIEHIVSDTPHQPAVIHFRNGDQLTGTFPINMVKAQSALGEINVPLTTIKKITFTKDHSDTPTGGLIYWNTFDSEAATREPKIGPKSSIGAARLTDGVKGQALHTGGNSDALSFLIPPNTLKSKGCIEFWAKLDPRQDSFGIGSNPRFFWLSRPGSFGGIRIDYSANNGVGAGGLTAIFNNISCGTAPHLSQNTYSSILGMDYRAWHHYALVWNKDGIGNAGHPNPLIALYLDGKLVSKQVQAQGQLSVEGTITQETLFTVASYVHARPSDVSFAIDELKIWNYDKTEFGILNDLASLHQYAD